MDPKKKKNIGKICREKESFETCIIVHGRIPFAFFLCIRTCLLLFNPRICRSLFVVSSLAANTLYTLLKASLKACLVTRKRNALLF